MAESKKNYRSFTGLKEFYYGELDEATNAIVGSEAERIKFIQNIAIETPQEIVKAPGDNVIAEMAISTDATTLTTTFHTLPIEDKKRLYGLKDIKGLTAVTGNPQPPYVACMFARTNEKGGMEWIGFTKGMFMMPGIDGQTKEPGSVVFGTAETEGEFMSREVDGLDEEVTYLIGFDEKGETKQRDALYKAIFGVAHPDAGKETEPEGA